ncbi:MAG: hypothetical protein U1E17_05070 [Geminicoccaceae bacterium]
MRAQAPEAVSVTVTLTASHQAVEILRGDGERRCDLRPLVRLNVAVVLECGGRRESGGHGGGGRHGLERLPAEGWWQGVADEAVRQARAAGVRAAPAGEMTVVLGPAGPA